MPADVVPNYQLYLLMWCLTIAMPADLLPLLHARRFAPSISDIPADVVPHYQPCLLVWCYTRGHAFWSCLLVWCITIGHACWCGTPLETTPFGVVPLIDCVCWCSVLLSAVTADVVPHYQPCLLVWCLTTGHACLCVASL